MSPSSPEKPKPPHPSRKPAAPLLAQLIAEIESMGPLYLNFEDLTGITLDVPELQLPSRNRFHVCNFCMLAKRTRNGHLRCNQNKDTVNRLARRRGTGFIGLCHLGMTDIVEPLVYHGRTLGVFYYGSVLVEGTREQAEERIRRDCKKGGTRPGLLLRELGKAPVVPADDLPIYRKRLLLIRDLAIKIIEAWGVPVERYSTLLNFGFTSNRRQLPPLTRAAMSYVHRSYQDPLEVITIAQALKCQPSHLSRVFKKSAGYSLSDYIKRVRIDHAMRLLASSEYSVGEIGYMVGFQDQSHFGKIFRSFLKMTPLGYRQSYQKGDISGKADSETIAFSNFQSL